MKTSVCLTVFDRPHDVLLQVFDSLAHETHDELVIVLDRSPEPTADFCRNFWQDDTRVRFVPIEGDPGWKSPVTAWNAGISAVSGELLYCLSSDTVQTKGNVLRAATLCQDLRTVLHGKAECSCGPQGQEVNWAGTAPGNLFCDSKHPRPLGFIWAGPTSAVKRIGGYDPAFADGLWFDDNDFFLRLWHAGVDFLFDDSVSGTHLHHDRPVLSTPDGQAKIARNQTLMLQKHASILPWPSLPKLVTYEQPGRTRWSHL